MNRELDGCYFRIVRDGVGQSVCFTDLTKEERAMTRIFEVIVAKNRHGETKTVKMGWVPQFTKFRTLLPEDEEKLLAEKQREQD